MTVQSEVCTRFITCIALMEDAVKIRAVAVFLFIICLLLFDSVDYQSLFVFYVIVPFLDNFWHIPYIRCILFHFFFFMSYMSYQHPSDRFFCIFRRRYIYLYRIWSEWKRSNSLVLKILWLDIYICKMLYCPEIKKLIHTNLCQR